MQIGLSQLGCEFAHRNAKYGIFNIKAFKNDESKKNVIFQGL